MDANQLIMALGGAGGFAGLLAAALRSKRLRAILSGILENATVKDTLESLRQIVEAQGESIEWLRDELKSTRLELEEAREKLAQTAILTVENAQLRARVAELELHVARLEARLKENGSNQGS